MAEVENFILSLLNEQSGPITYSYINALLPAWDFEHISKSLEALKQKGLVHIGIEGITIKRAIPSESSAPTSFGQSTDAAETVDGDDLDYDVLIGEESQKTSNQYAQIAEEELSALIASIDNRPSILSYSDEKTIGAESPNTTENSVFLDAWNGNQRGYTPLHMHDSLDFLELPARIKNTLKKNGVHTVAELISELDSFLGANGLGKKSKAVLEELLTSSALIDQSIQTSEQLNALQCLSNNPNYFFDAFGTLSTVQGHDFKLGYPEPSAPTSNLEDNKMLLSIDALNMGDATTRCFKRNGVTTIEDLVCASDEQLLKLRGIGLKKVLIARDALEVYFSQNADGRPDVMVAVVGSRINPAAFKSYLGEYPDEAIEILDESIASLAADNIDVNPNAFTVTYLPLAQEALDISDGNLEIAKELALEAIYQSPSTSRMLKALLTARLQRARSKELSEKREYPVVVPRNALFRTLLLEVVNEAGDCSLDEKTGTIRFHHPTMQKWIASLPERDAGLINLRLQGYTLDECGKQAGGITREWVRQILDRILNERPLLSEDSFRPFYMTYEVSETKFQAITGADRIVSKYFQLTSERSERKKLPLSKALYDDSVPEEAKSRIRSCLNENFFFADGERIHKDRKSILNYLIGRLTEHSNVTMHDLMDAYERFLDGHSAASTELAFTTFHNFQEWVKRNIPEILNVRNGEEAYIRYYDANQHDFTKLREFMLSGRFENIECSAALLFHHPEAAELIQELDIRDEYELHYIAKNYCDLPSSVIFKRMPTIVFGSGNREKQVLELIQEKGPIDAHTLSELYKDKYGVSEEVFRGSFLNGFEAYKHHGKYSCSFEEMTVEQLDSMTSILTKDYQPLHLVKLQFKDKYPDASDGLINKLNLERIGFRTSHELIIRQELNEARVFQTLIDTNSVFGSDTNGFCAEVLKHPAFESLLRVKLNSLEIVEYEKGKYIHLERVIDALNGKVSGQDFKDYVEQVVNFVEKGAPFTVFSLKRAGFTHPVENAIEDVGLGDTFLESLISSARVGGRIKSTTVNKRNIFCKTPYRFSVVDFFEYVMANAKRIEVDDLCALAHDEYSVDFSPTLTRSIIKRSDLYFSDTLDMVFESIDEYDEMVKRILERDN